jgi:hypothetical protein
MDQTHPDVLLFLDACVQDPGVVEYGNERRLLLRELLLLGQPLVVGYLVGAVAHRAGTPTV